MKRCDSLPEFDKEFKHFLKKYKTLRDDFEKFKEVLEKCPLGIGKNFTITHSTPNLKIVKARLACRALREKSLRVIYAYQENEKKVDFIEIYFKGEKENEDRERIKGYLSRN